MPVSRWRAVLAAAAASALVSAAAPAVAQTDGHREVTEVRGHAAGSQARSYLAEDDVLVDVLVELAPEVVLPADGGGPFTESLPLLTFQDGDSGEQILASNLEVSTEGALGPDGFVASSSTLSDLGAFSPQSHLSAELVDVECRSEAAGAPVASTSIIAGTAYDLSADEFIDLPEAPEPNTVLVDYDEQVEIHGNMVDFRMSIVVNEQIVDGRDISVTGVRYHYEAEVFDSDTGELIGEHELRWVAGMAACGMDVADSVVSAGPEEHDTEDEASVAAEPAGVEAADVAPRFTG